MRELHDVPLAERTTLGIGGPARRLVEVEGEDELVAALREASAATQDVLILGGGSNLVVADQGLAAWVIQPKGGAVHVERDGDKVRLHADAGLVFDELVEHCVQEGLADLECLSGIPGLVGATPLQNVGAYGQQISDVLERVRVYDRDDASIVTLSAAECAFGYRDSAFKSRWDPGRFVVLGVTLRLREGPPAPPAYAELQRALEARGGEATLEAIRATVLEMRRKKGMVVDPSDPDSRSAGSFFVNPHIAKGQVAAVERRARQGGALDGKETLRTFSADAQRVKVPAAYLIERSGFCKGYVRGAVGISSKHALALVNRGGATAQQIVDLAQEIRAAVFERFGIWLTPEPRFVGFESPPFPPGGGPG